MHFLVPKVFSSVDLKSFDTYIKSKMNSLNEQYPMRSYIVKVKKEPYRFSDQQDPLVHTDKHPFTFA